MPLYFITHKHFPITIPYYSLFESSQDWLKTTTKNYPIYKKISYTTAIQTKRYYWLKTKHVIRYTVADRRRWRHQRGLRSQRR